MALVTPVFLDTSVWLGGLIEMGGEHDAAQEILDVVANQKARSIHTAWHCCLEFFSVATRLPPPYRLPPADAIRLLEVEILGRCRVHQLPEEAFVEFLRRAERERAAGGRIYDAHIAEIARRAGVRTVLTENVRHFSMLAQHGIRVLTAAEALSDI
jgi:predicted nucleic acid-binding protein